MTDTVKTFGELRRWLDARIQENSRPHGLMPRRETQIARANALAEAWSTTLALLPPPSPIEDIEEFVVRMRKLATGGKMYGEVLAENLPEARRLLKAYSDDKTTVSATVATLLSNAVADIERSG